MSRARVRLTIWRRPLLALALALPILALATFDQAVRAADEVLAADVVAALQQAGMDCTSGVGYSYCDVGADCTFGPTGEDTCTPGGLPWGLGRVRGPDHPSGVFPNLGIDVEYTTNDPSDARGLFKAVALAACPAVSDATAAWVADPGKIGSFDGDGCGIYLTSAASVAGPETTYMLAISLDPPDPAATPEVSTSPGSSAPAPAVVASAQPTSPVATPDGGIAGTGEFVASIPTPARVNSDPSVLLQSALLAALILLLMPFPAQLFNSTLEEHRAEIEGWFAPLMRGMRGAGRGIGTFWRSPAGIALFVVISAALYALLDPSFTISTDGLVTLVGILIGIVVVTVLFSLPSVLWHRRYGDRPMVEVIPITLVVAIVCVAVSRLADFQPGYLYGLIIGLGFARELDATGEGRSGAVAAALMLIAALIAWIALGLLVDSGVQGLVTAIGSTVLAAIMVAGLEGVAFGLLPIRSLPGEPIYRWNRIVWAALIGLGLFAFLHVLINPQSGYLADSSRTPLSTMLALLIGFGLLSVAFWSYFRFRPEPANR